MLQFTRRVLQEAGWGLPASVVLHLVLATLFLVRLPALPSPASEQSVNVELVQPPPPEKKPQQQAPKTPEQAAPPPQPQAFESASAKQDVKSPPEQDLPPAAPEEIQKPDEPSETAATTDADKAEEKPSVTEGQPSEQLLQAEKPSESGQAAAEKTQTAPKQKADTPKPATPAKKLTRAREIYSKDAMSDPRVKQALGKLAPKDRIIQICGIEALEQVRRHKAGAFPDMLAREGGSVSTTGLTVSDGAFRSQRKWYAIDFTCKVDAETMVIGAFSYNIGRAIPEREWARRQLPRD
ncbi:DUF930 domain-containing protein [Ochrobactrum sp. MH181795]|uniref:DUF930 domain-containing protein n=1 Tax=Brucella lupini TaxID=255457 RepID=A0A256GE67_9HYPH|nr:DUF930 domain-containing protein [Brucella anthropi]KAB2699887.1 DUF930 domain-containing protein [Brucella lupini]RNL40718.1 DUF930 domain-containing protein [Ochrobactrum sp. MH181795]KAB2726096.1 DUF930 domain-containing protein [Brucella anthropi]KAB2743409.1 DUF930 domain-containing protein [Brucella anthropi]KAB2804229.1 DUF930 domain-containing protein [Brucella anthropi]